MNRLPSHVLTAVTICAGASAPAQSPNAPVPNDHFVVLPADFAGTRFAPWNVFPGDDVHLAPIIHQYVFAIPPTVPGPTRSIAFRRADANSVALTLPAFDVDVELGMGHSPLAPSDIQFRHAAMRGPDFGQVTARRVVRFPAVPWQPNGSYAFTHRIPIDRPFQFTGGANGVVEITFWASTLSRSVFQQGVGSFDGLFSSGMPSTGPGNGILDRFGLPCSPTGNSWENRLLLTSWPAIGNANRAFLTAQSVSYLPETVRFFLGGSDWAWGGASLPFSLGAVGAPSCMVYSSWEWPLPMLTTSPNTPWYWSSADLSIPNDPRLIGAMVFLQAVRVSGRPNAQTIATSDAWRMRILPKIVTPVSYTHRSAIHVGTFGPEFVDNFGLGGPVIMLDGR